MKIQFDDAWAAGLFEGEGCFTGGSVHLSGNKTFRATAALAQKDTWVLDRFLEVVGFGHIGSVCKDGTSRWQTSKYGEVALLLERLRPWLSPRRVARGEEVLRLQAESRNGRATRNYA